VDSIQLDFIIKRIFTLAFVITFLADTWLIHIISSRAKDLSNSYYSFHKRMGFTKTTVLKILLLSWIIYGLIIEPSGKSGAIFTIIIGYCINFVKLLADYRKAIIKQQ
jgi:hypothetical protein